MVFSTNIRCMILANPDVGTYSYFIASIGLQARDMTHCDSGFYSPQILTKTFDECTQVLQV